MCNQINTVSGFVKLLKSNELQAKTYFLQVFNNLATPIFNSFYPLLLKKENRKWYNYIFESSYGFIKMQYKNRYNFTNIYSLNITQLIDYLISEITFTESKINIRFPYYKKEIAINPYNIKNFPYKVFQNELTEREQDLKNTLELLEKMSSKNNYLGITDFINKKKELCRSVANTLTNDTQFIKDNYNFILLDISLDLCNNFENKDYHLYLSTFETFLFSCFRFQWLNYLNAKKKQNIFDKDPNQNINNKFNPVQNYSLSVFCATCINNKESYLCFDEIIKNKMRYDVMFLLFNIINNNNLKFSQKKKCVIIMNMVYGYNYNEIKEFIKLKFGTDHSVQYLRNMQSNAIKKIKELKNFNQIKNIILNYINI